MCCPGILNSGVFFAIPAKRFIKIIMIKKNSFMLGGSTEDGRASMRSVVSRHSCGSSLSPLPSLIWTCVAHYSSILLYFVSLFEAIL